MAADDDPMDWLPSGWTFQIKKINDRKVQCYLDPEGRKFYSKPQVFQYLKTITNSTAISQSHYADGPSEGASLDPDVSRQNEVPESLPQHNGDHLAGEKSASQPELSKGKEISESLPNGWIVQLNTKGNGMKYKCYVDPETGRKFYSKPAVSRYLKSISSSKVSEKTVVNQESVGYLTGGGTSTEPDASQKDSNWLPDGWVVEVKTRDRGKRPMNYKCFTDPVSGRKFFSKPQVLNYLATGKSSMARKRKGGKSSSKPDMSQKSEATDVGHNISKTKNERILKSTDEEVISRTPADGLPQGWIKEIRSRKHATVVRKDPYYVDPSSDYMFRSKLDALRYLQTGDITKCAIRPKRRDINEIDSYNGDQLTGEKWASPTDLFKENDISEPLPTGWVVEVKKKSSGVKYKCYIDPESGRKFHSRPQVSRYLKNINSGKAGDKTVNVGDGSLSKADASQTEVSDWLPDGWIMEVKTTNTGLKKKSYTETISGQKFYSKPRVLNYIAAKDSSVTGIEMPQNSEAGGSRKKKFSKKKKKHANEFDNREVISRTAVEGLPPGWIKELRTRKHGTQHDPFYIDPLSGYMFRSKLDAFRYLETGDIKNCAIRPLKRDTNEKEASNHAVDGQTPVNATAKRQLFEDNTTPTESLANKTAKRNKEINGSKKSPTTLPGGRSSKRLKGMEAETKGDPSLNKRTTRAASRGPATQPERETNEGKNHLEDNEVVQDGRVNVGKQTNDEMAESETSYPLGDSLWTDPCLDFAVKTLTGEILGDGQQGSASCQQENVGLEPGTNGGPTKVNRENEGPMKVN